MNLSPQKFIVLAYLLSYSDMVNADIWQLRQDLDIENQPLALPSTTDILLSQAKPRKELCLGCLKPTGYGNSYELAIGCGCDVRDAEAKWWHIKHLLAPDANEGRARRALHQFIYQTLEDIGYA